VFYDVEALPIREVLEAIYDRAVKDRITNPLLKPDNCSTEKYL